MEIKFKPEEIKERRNKDGSVSTFPIVGGRLRIAHETNDQLSITTELLSHVPLEGATMKATIATTKGLFSAYGAASASKDARLIDSLLELAETRAIARALRFAGYGVEYTGSEEMPDDGQPVRDNHVQKQQETQSHVPDDDFIPMTRAQRHAIEVISKVNNWPVMDAVRRILKRSDIANLDEVTKDDASVVIGRMFCAYLVRSGWMEANTTNPLTDVKNLSVNNIFAMPHLPKADDSRRDVEQGLISHRQLFVAHQELPESVEP